jgi:hypothetical protein
MRWPDVLLVLIPQQLVCDKPSGSGKLRSDTDKVHRSSFTPDAKENGLAALESN